MFGRAWSFFRRVFHAFRHNQGVLLSGAVAYYTLLSIVPLFAVLLAVLSRFVDRRRLLDVLTANLALVIDRQARAVTDQVATFLDASGVIGVFGGVAVLFFGGILLFGAQVIAEFERSTPPPNAPPPDADDMQLDDTPAPNAEPSHVPPP